MAKFTKNDIQKLQLRWKCFAMTFAQVKSARSLLDMERKINPSFNFESIAPPIEGNEGLFAFCVRLRKCEENEVKNLALDDDGTTSLN